MRILPLLFILSLLAACAPSDDGDAGSPRDAAEAPVGEGGAPAADETVSLLDYRAVVPIDWDQREPSSSMRLTEFVTDPDAGEESPEVVVFYFGPTQGGSVEANVARWQSQFTAPGGGPVEPEVEELEETTFPTTVARFEGAYARSVGMGMGGGEAEPDQAMDGAIVETPQGNLFIQIFGPREEVAEEREDFMRFVRSIGG